MTYPYLNPVIDVKINGQLLSVFTSRFEVTSDLNGKADTCVVQVAGYAGKFSRGDSIVIKWGYAGEDLTEIFRGVVMGVSHNDPVVITGIDYNCVLNSKRLNMTFEDDAASGIIRSLLANSGLKLAVEDCPFEIERLPFFSLTIRECVDKVTDIVRRETGEQFYDYIREGVFHWGPKDLSQSPVHSFETGMSIIRTEQYGNLTMLETMVVPVHHSDVIQVDGENRFIVKVEYLWDSGGRTKLWY